MRAWLKLRKVQAHKKMDLLGTMKPLWVRECDEKYAKQLHQCFVAIGDSHSAEQVDRILEQWRSAKIKEITW